jgi:magnesium-transporting ATPase (P-type)
MDESAITGESKKFKKASYKESVDELNRLRKRDPGDISTSSVPSPVILSGTKVTLKIIL